MRGEPSSLKFNISSEDYQIENHGNDRQFIDIIRKNLSNSVDPDIRWNEQFNKCVEFKIKYDRYPANKKRNINEKKLGQWLG